MKLNKCHFFSKEIQHLGHILSTKGIWPLPSKTQAIQKMHPPTTLKQVHAFLSLVGYYRKIHQKLCKNSQTFDTTDTQASEIQLDTNPHCEAFLHLKESITQAPILCYPDPNKRYIVYTDASYDACWA